MKKEKHLNQTSMTDGFNMLVFFSGDLCVFPHKSWPTNQPWKFSESVTSLKTVDLSNHFPPEEIWKHQFQRMGTNLARSRGDDHRFHHGILGSSLEGAEGVGFF